MDIETGLNAGLEEKVAVLTGAASGIGNACAELFSVAGQR